jgi:hypothetical protein
VDRARHVLRSRPERIAGGLDPWASLLGVKLVRARAACRAPALGEVELLYDAAGRRDRAVPCVSPEEAGGLVRSRRLLTQLEA